MVRLNVIYTRTGDKGETGLGDGSRRPKCDARVAAMGDVDETNCAVGLARLAVRASADAAVQAIEPTLARIQNDLFDLGADLCLPPDEGEKPAAALHQARAVCRRADRSVVMLAAREGEHVGETALAYVNRLSDYLFVAAR